MGRFAFLSHLCMGIRGNVQWIS